MAKRRSKKQKNDQRELLRGDPIVEKKPRLLKTCTKCMARYPENTLSITGTECLECNGIREELMFRSRRRAVAKPLEAALREAIGRSGEKSGESIMNYAVCADCGRVFGTLYKKTDTGKWVPYIGSQDEMCTECRGLFELFIQFKRRKAEIAAAAEAKKQAEDKAEKQREFVRES